MSKSRKSQDFSPNEFVVYPAHGVGQIISVEEQEVAGISLELFVISFEKDKMTLRVPTHKALEIGMRALSSPDVINVAMKTLKGKAKVKRAMWSRRAQEYEAKIKAYDEKIRAEVLMEIEKHRMDVMKEVAASRKRLKSNSVKKKTTKIVVEETFGGEKDLGKITKDDELKLHGNLKWTLWELRAFQ